jgi:hypothetical protein
VLRDQRNKFNMDRFVEQKVSDRDHFVMRSNYINREPDTIRLVVSGRTIFDSAKVESLKDSLPYYRLEGRYLDMQQFGSDEAEIATRRSLRSDLETRENLEQALAIKTSELRNQQSRLDSLINTLNETRRYAVAPDRIGGELQVIYPQLERLTIGYTEPDSAGNKAVLAILSWQKGKISSGTKRVYEKRISQFLKQRLEADSVLLK